MGSGALTVAPSAPTAEGHKQAGRGPEGDKRDRVVHAKLRRRTVRTGVTQRGRLNQPSHVTPVPPHPVITQLIRDEELAIAQLVTLSTPVTTEVNYCSLLCCDHGDICDTFQVHDVINTPLSSPQ